MTKAQTVEAMKAASLEAVAPGAGAEITFRCPVHERRAGKPDRNPSASLNVDKGVWRCYSCGARGTAKKLLGQHFVPAPLDRERALASRGGGARKEAKLPSDFKKLLKPTNYLKLRGVHADTVAAWSLGVAGDYVIAPAMAGGKLIGWVGRAVTPGREPRCDMPHGVSDFVLGYDQAAARTDPREVVVVEGMFDAFRVWQAGFPVVAVLGRASVARRQFIHALGRPVVVFPDADPGGEAMCSSLMPLSTSRRVRVARCPDGRTDPGECSVAEIRAAVRGAV